jgi:hypothetical protein
MRIRTRFNGQTSKFTKRTLFFKKYNTQRFMLPISLDSTFRQCGRSRMFIPDPTFFHPGSRIRTLSIPDPGSSKNLSISNSKKAKKWFLSSKKYDPGCSSRIRMLTFSHPGSRGQKGTQSRIPDPDLLLGKSCNQVQFVSISTALILTDVTNRLKIRL